jgi:hypothetical protein
MKKLVILSVLALFVVVAGCRDLRHEVPVQAEVTGPAFSASGSGGSVVCVAYENNLNDFRAQLAQNPDNAALQVTVQQHEDFIATQCD